MLIAIAVCIVMLMGGLAVVMLYALRVDLNFARDAWQRLTCKQQMLQLVAVLAWFVGLAAGFAVGYAISGNWEGGVAGAVVFAFGLAVIGPLLALRIRRKT